MKAAYVAKAKIPSQSANSIHVMKICEAFSKMCEEFELIVPKETEEIAGENIFNYYGVEEFNVTRVKRKKTLYNYYFAVSVMKIIIKDKCTHIITRDPLVAFFSVLLHKKVVLDLHGEIAHLCGRAYRMIKWDFFRKSKYLKIVMITDSLRQYYQKKYGLDPDLVKVLPDGCTLENFAPYADAALLENEKANLAYVGSFGVGRGYEIIQDMAEKDKMNQYNIYGGTKDDAIKITGKIPGDNIKFHGFIANREVPEALSMQDILLLPYQNTLIAKGEDTGKVMSPLKLFEYMASGRVIIASDLPVLKEIINEQNCYLADPENVDSWKEAVDDILSNREEARNRARKAQEDVRKYTWKNRAEEMLKLIM